MEKRKNELARLKALINEIRSERRNAAERKHQKETCVKEVREVSCTEKNHSQTTTNSICHIKNCVEKENLHQPEYPAGNHEICKKEHLPQKEIIISSACNKQHDANIADHVPCLKTEKTSEYKQYPKQIYAMEDETYRFKENSCFGTQHSIQMTDMLMEKKTTEDTAYSSGKQTGGDEDHELPQKETDDMFTYTNRTTDDKERHISESINTLKDTTLDEAKYLERKGAYFEVHGEEKEHQLRQEISIGSHDLDDVKLAEHDLWLKTENKIDKMLPASIKDTAHDIQHQRQLFASESDANIVEEKTCFELRNPFQMTDIQMNIKTSEKTKQGSGKQTYNEDNHKLQNIVNDDKLTSASDIEQYNDSKTGEINHSKATNYTLEGTTHGIENKHILQKERNIESSGYEKNHDVGYRQQMYIPKAEANSTEDKTCFRKEYPIQRTDINMGIRKPAKTTHVSGIQTDNAEIHELRNKQNTDMFSFATKRKANYERQISETMDTNKDTEPEETAHMWEKITPLAGTAHGEENTEHICLETNHSKLKHEELKSGKYSATSASRDSKSYDHIQSNKLSNILHTERLCNSFEFTIAREAWEDIKPEVKVYGGRGRSIRKLTGAWTDVFSEKLSETNEGCCLVFKTQNVKKENSRKVAAPFFKATAVCRGVVCSAKYIFIIDSDPGDKNDAIICCTIEGKITHSRDEVNRRNLAYERRTKLAERLVESTSASVFYDSLTKSNNDQLAAGNYTDVPNPTVLRKIISEEFKKEHLHANIMAELQLLKEAYEADKDPFIREIGLDPFCVILYSERQIGLMKTYAATVPLHFDATGSVIQNIPGQKRPFLYSIVMRPNPDLPPVSIADMITTQHTIPRIEFFLSSIQRAGKMTGQHIHIKRIEMDFSYALIQASLKVFNNMDVKSYLKACCEYLLKSNDEVPFMTLHLCAAHMFKDFVRQLKKYNPNIPKLNRVFCYKAFALLQNAPSLDEAKSIFSDLCVITLSQTKTHFVETSYRRLQDKMRVNIGGDEEQETDNEEIMENTDLSTEENTTIRKASPFDKMFFRIYEKLEYQHSENLGPPNSFHCKEVVTCLLERFLYLIPLWSGLMLTKNGEGCTRDTNADVESWFKVLKHDFVKGNRNRPSKAILNLRKLVVGRMQELMFPGARKPKTKLQTSKVDETGISISLKEEIWSRAKARKTKYQPQSQSRTTQKKHRKISLPDVAKWGGGVGGRTLSNTCTIDNGLTIIHLNYQESSSLKRYFSESASDLFKTLLTIFSLMDEGSFDAAKMIWVNFTKLHLHTERAINLHGDEAEQFFAFLDEEWRSSVVSRCQEGCCPQPYKEHKEVHGVTISLAKPVAGPQEMVDLWLENKTRCWAVNSDDKPVGDEPEIITETCHGDRLERRTIRQESPIFVLRVHEHFINDNISLDQILNQTKINIDGKQYSLAGCTTHTSNHFAAVVKTNNHGSLWYDGLVGKLMPYIDQSQNCSVSHVVYCKM